MSVDIKMTGVNELTKAFKELGPKVERKIGMKAMRKGGKAIVKEAKALAPRKTGRLIKAVAVLVAKGSGRRIHLQVGVKRGRKRTDKKGAWYAHFIEFGTKQIAARPFLRPALDSQKENVVAITGKNIFIEVLKELKK